MSGKSRHSLVTIVAFSVTGWDEAIVCVEDEVFTIENA